MSKVFATVKTGNITQHMKWMPTLPSAQCATNMTSQPISWPKNFLIDQMKQSWRLFGIETFRLPNWSCTKQSVIHWIEIEFGVWKLEWKWNNNSVVLQITNVSVFSLCRTLCTFRGWATSELHSSTNPVSKTNYNSDQRIRKNTLEFYF